MGTAFYMSPEQVRGEKLDARTDLFSFGLVLYEMTTGQRAFAGKTAAAVHDAILLQAPLPLRQVKPDLPMKLEQIITKALEKDRRLRYQSAAEMRIDLRGLKQIAQIEQAMGISTIGAIADSKRPVISDPFSKGARKAARVAIALVLTGLIGGFLYHRSQHSKRLADNDTIVLADFANTTGDSIFDDTLEQALFLQLSQSPFLNILPQKNVSGALKLMGIEPGSRLSQNIALEICRRTNSKVMIAGSISHPENRYVIALRAVACVSGEVVEEDQTGSVARGAVLLALDKAATSMRAKLGESINTIQKYDTPIAQATTPSLEALKVFTEAVNIQRQRGDSDALPLLKRAVELDPNFALAYSDLGVAYFNLKEQSLAEQNYQKAFELRHRVSDREAFHIAADYYDSVTGELDKSDEVYEAWAKAYPRDDVPVGNLATNYAWEGKSEKSLAANIQALNLNQDDLNTYSNLVADYATLGRLDEAKSTYEQALTSKHESGYLHMNRYAVAFLENDKPEMQRQLASVAGQPYGEDALLSFQADTEAYFGNLKQARELTQRAAKVAVQNDRKETAAVWLLDAALREAEVGKPATARELIRSALGLAQNRDLKILAALACARSGDAVHAAQLAADVSRSSPLNSLLNGYWLPTIRASIELNRKQPRISVEALRAASSYELGSPPPTTTSGSTLYPVYVRAEAYLKAGDSAQAGREFMKVIASRNIVQNGVLGALAYLQLGRSDAQAGKVEESRKAYQDFLALCKDADPDIAILKQAKAEYAKLR
jgi:tetratricopeptide (TPR) repeat protein